MILLRTQILINSLFSIDHANPTMVLGHPFKGGEVRSTGMLAHPDMKRFAINDPTLFVPPRPSAFANTMIAGAGIAPVIPSFGDFFATYFAGKSFNVSEPRCSSMLEGMKKCYENHTEDPVDSCAYYVQGFERFACGK